MKEDLIIYRFIVMNSSNCPSFQLPLRLKRDVFKMNLKSYNAATEVISRRFAFPACQDQICSFTETHYPMNHVLAGVASALCAPCDGPARSSGVQQDESQ